MNVYPSLANYVHRGSVYYVLYKYEHMMVTMYTSSTTSDTRVRWRMEVQDVVKSSVG